MLPLIPTANAATDTFGYTTIGTAYTNQNINGQIRGYTFTLPYSGSIVSITAALKTDTSTTTPIKCAVYYSNLSLAVATQEVNTALTSSFAWKTFPLSTAVNLTAGNYVLVAWADDNPNVYLAGDAGVAGQSKYDSDAIYGNFPNPLSATPGEIKYSVYASYSISIAYTSSPVINPNITVNGTTYATPQTVLSIPANYTLTADSARIYNSNGYGFDHWLINGTTTNTARTINLEITGATTITTYYTASSNVFVFYGPFSETTGLQLNESATVTVHYTTPSIPNDELTLNGSCSFVPSGTVQYFNYLFSDNTTRQYWVDPSETITSFYVFRDDNLARYTINFLDYTGLLKTYPYVTAKTYINGSLFTVEKEKVDSDNTFSMELLTGRTYQLLIGNQYYSHTYGDLLMTAASSVQLVLRGVDFPKESLLLYQYVHAYALRDYLNPTGAITVSYEDIKNQTTSVLIEIKYDNGTIADTQTFTNQTFSYTWNSAVNATNYQVIVTVDHSVYGTFYFKQYLIGEYTKPSEPFNLDAFGTLPGIETAWFLPALLIIFVAACFSELTSEVACVLTAITAIFLSAIGFIPISTGALVTALALGIMAGVISVRRRYF